VPRNHRDTIAQTRSKNISKFSNDSLLEGVNTPRSDKDSLKLKELMKLCTNLQNRVLDLKTTKTTQALETDSLKRKVTKLEKKQRSRIHKLKRLNKVGLTVRVDSSNEASLGNDASKQEKKINDIDVDEGITLVDNTVENQRRINDQKDVDMLFDVPDDLRGEEVFVLQDVPLKEVNVAAATTTTPTISIDEVTLAQALAELKHTESKAKAKGTVFHEPEKTTPTLQALMDGKKMIKTESTVKRDIQLEDAKDVPLKEVNVAAATTTTPTISIDEVTLAQALAELKHTESKAKAKGTVFHEPEKTTPTVSSQQPSQIKLQAEEEEEEERLAREKLNKLKKSM
nr:hypothetical protein [Tanacetum cinerariifolium]